ncbi:MAG: hypothetical protein OXG35_33885 [Acidobacteria bacterium]|nr:hypothetical protein [Acidobacteriota bacterium]
MRTRTVRGVTLVRRTEAELARRKRNWELGVVRNRHRLWTQTGSIPPGTLLRVSQNRGGLQLNAMPCRCCGKTFHIRGVSEGNVEYLGHLPDADGKPDTSFAAKQRLDAWHVNEVERPLRITFTGVDRWTDLQALRAINRRYPELEIEYAVLTGTPDGKEARFPGQETIDSLRSWSWTSPFRAAIHLCGRRARAVNARETTEIEKLCKDFDRIQVNSREYDYDAVERLAERTQQPVIVQERSNFNGEPPRAGLSYLHDRSGGQGVDTLDEWGIPWPNVPCGYAGGLNPGNVARAVAKLQGLGRADAWIDMESGVRTDDRLDTTKVDAVCKAATETLERIRGEQRNTGEARDER